MADTSTKISAPVKIEQHSPEAVAFDLMKYISLHESVDPKDRKYWLSLYRECLRATSGFD